MGDFGITQPNQFDDAIMPNRLKLTAFPSGFIDEVDVLSYYVVKLDDGSQAGQLIGGVSLSHRGDRVPVDIGWCFREEFHGNGYATEAALALKQLALETLHIKHLVALPACKNEASKAVARKIGLVEGCILEEPDRSLPSCVYYLPGTPISPHMMDKVPKENLRDFEPVSHISLLSQPLSCSFFMMIHQFQCIVHLTSLW